MNLMVFMPDGVGDLLKMLHFYNEFDDFIKNDMPKGEGDLLNLLHFCNEFDGFLIFYG